MEILFNNKTLSNIPGEITICYLEEYAKNHLRLQPEDYYLISNGKRINNIDSHIKQIRIVPKLIGGKGGFGSMLRAIGAQIEKTTNREACRDLSGRRLRDINEEQRLKNWIATQAEREEEAAKRKQKKLERLCQQPKHEFKDEEYDKERSALPEKVEDAVTQGLKAACSSSSKRKHEETSTSVKKKKRKLWIDEDEFSSSEDEIDEKKESNSSEEVTRDNILNESVQSSDDNKVQ